MLVRFSSALLGIVYLALLQPAALAASASIHDARQAAEAGHIAEAQAMLQEIVSSQPENAEAHYIKADLYTKSSQFDYARRELKTAKRLDPSLSFASPSAVEALQTQLAITADPVMPATRNYSLPWRALVLGSLLTLGIVVMWVRKTR